MNIRQHDTSLYCQQGPLGLAPINQGVLDGTSFVFKDLFDVEGFTTGVGNPTWLATHPVAKSTSPIIETLLKQGASCVGRVQTDELAYSLNGTNVHYGMPLNPLAPDCIPGGSSSGSAVAVALGHADFAIGTDTGGSVRVPASYCGLYGLRPTLGSLTLEHCFELSSSFDTAGVFTRNLTTMKTVFSALNQDRQQVERVDTLYLDQDLAQFLSKERHQMLVKWCESAGISIKPVRFLADIGLNLNSLSLMFRTIQGYEIIQTHEQWLSQHGESLDPRIMQRVKWARTISEDDYLSAKSEQASFTDALVNNISMLKGAWLLPTTPMGPPKLNTSDSSLAQYRTELMGLTSIAGLAGIPQLHLPMPGMIEGPTGMSLMGLANSESTLIATAERMLEGEWA
ncbi:glutamyl-tRNA(Gln) amidotransferase [Vibrio inusitatus NBRC 102082]|uniref:Glutamyl-tRNA(Gln) amidotransferase n=1 Tax=Vibrio inusitatus NBRC 102082 TaxID=1219070 RepID=A0A4Y3HY15_9VIBR|nr:amidase [Vibrio inusitatus]GEA51898.1 glutamyl-tRNA(Gln) amidotransferase [Vibrio inusitatus NBRC 102082]